MPSKYDSRERRLKLIEILLLIGSIITAFNPERVDQSLFYPFIIFSLINYISILYKSEHWFNNFTIFLMSLLFSAIIAILYGTSVENILSVPSTIVTYIFLTTLLTLVLMRDKDLKRIKKFFRKANVI